jgi:hypothetical protein
MTYPMLQHIPLKSAYLCQDCNSIGNCAEQCPACASAVLLNLSGVLDRDTVIKNELELYCHHSKPVAGTVLELTTMVA